MQQIYYVSKLACNTLALPRKCFARYIGIKGEIKEVEVEDSTMVFLMVILNTINLNLYYLDGVSITHGSPHQHVWALLQQHKLQLLLEVFIIAHALLVAFSKFLHSWETIITV